MYKKKYVKITTTMDPTVLVNMKEKLKEINSDKSISYISQSDFVTEAVKQLLNKVKQMPRKLTAEQFIEKAIKVHGSKYNYTKVSYLNSTTKVIITCPIHGDWEQLPNNHLKGKGCYKCGKSQMANVQRKTLKRVYTTSKFSTY